MARTKKQRAIAMGAGQHAARGMAGTVGAAMLAKRELDVAAYRARNQTMPSTRLARAATLDSVRAAKVLTGRARTRAYFALLAMADVERERELSTGAAS